MWYELEGLVALHLLLWKHFIALLVRIELEGETYDESQVWAPAWARLEKKILALKYKVDEVVRRAESRGDPAPDMRKRSGGDLIWNDEMVTKIKSFTERSEPYKKRRPTGGR